ADVPHAPTGAAPRFLPPPPPTDVPCPMDPPAAWGEAPSVGDAKSNAIIMHDSDVYWANKVADVAYSDDQERKWLAASFRAHSGPIWQIGRGGGGGGGGGGA